MLKKKVTLIAAIGLCAVGIAVGASATALVQKVQSEIRPDFTIAVDGKVQEFKNAQGETVYPMLYEGTTYLPVRAIGELMGKTVYWYEADKRIELKTEQTTVTDADVIVPGTSGTADTGTAAAQNGGITLSRAKEIALEKAGLKADEVTFTKAKLDTDDGVREYDIEFYKDGVEYSAEINAADGTVRSWDTERRDIYPTQNVSGQPSDIGLDRAKEIALEKAGLSASDVTFTEAKPDYDDGRYVYDIEFRRGRTEYSAEILASDGTVISWDIDND